MCPECERLCIESKVVVTETVTDVRAGHAHDRTRTYYDCSNGHQWKETTIKPCPVITCGLCIYPPVQIVIFGNPRARLSG